MHQKALPALRNTLPILSIHSYLAEEVTLPLGGRISMRHNIQKRHTQEAAREHETQNSKEDVVVVIADVLRSPMVFRNTTRRGFSKKECKTQQQKRHVSSLASLRLRALSSWVPSHMRSELLEHRPVRLGGLEPGQVSPLIA